MIPQSKSRDSQSNPVDEGKKLCCSWWMESDFSDKPIFDSLNRCDVINYNIYFSLIGLFDIVQSLCSVVTLNQSRYILESL